VQDLVAKMIRKLLLFALLLVLSAALLPAQEAAEARAEVTPSLYLFTAASGLSEQEERLLAELVYLCLSNDRALLLVEGELGEAVPEEDAAKTRLASEAGTEAWLELRAEPQGQELVLSYRLYLLASEILAVEERQLTSPGPVSALSEDFWRDLRSAVNQALPRRQQRIEVENRVVETREIRVIPYEVGVRVTVKALPGTRISGLTEKPLYADAGGTAGAEVTPNATYRLEAEHWRYLSQVQKIYVADSPQTVEFEQKPGTRFALEMLTHQEESLGLGLRWYPLPGVLFTGLRMVNSFQGLLPPYDLKNDDDRWFSRNLYLSLHLGGYLSSQNRRLRVGLAAGGFVRFYSHRNDSGLELHPVFPYGLTFGPLFEMSAGPRFAILLEWMPELYFYIPFDEFLTDPGGPYEYMERYPWDDLSGSGNIRFRMNSLFFGARYRL
jgi:hypothetical protein